VAVTLVICSSGCGSNGESGEGTSPTTAGTTGTTTVTTVTTSTTTSTTETAPVRPFTLVFPRPTATDYEFVPVQRETPTTGQAEVAALQLLVAGPTTDEMATQQLIDPFDRSPGTHVLSLTIADGTATADFSRELLGYGGGSAAVRAIGESITETLKRFPGVTKVVILVEGQPDLLQP